MGTHEHDVSSGWRAISVHLPAHVASCVGLTTPGTRATPRCTSTATAWLPRARGPARLRPGPVVSWPAPLAEDRAEREELVREEPRQEPVAAGSRIWWTRCRSRRVPVLPLLHGPSRWRGLHVTGEW